MLIGGLQKTTLIDYPGKVAATVFLIGCNFRCPGCQRILRGVMTDEGPWVVIDIPEDQRQQGAATLPGFEEPAEWPEVEGE